MLRLGRRIAIGLMNPARATQGLRPPLVIRHIVAVGEHHRANATHRCKPAGQGGTPARHIDQHIALSALHQPTACAEAFSRSPAAIKNLSTSCPSNQRRESIGGGVLQQLRAGFNRCHRAGLKCQQGLALGIRSAGLAMHNSGLSRRPVVHRIKRPAGAAVNAALIDEKRSWNVASNSTGHRPMLATLSSSSLLINHAAGLIGHRPYQATFGNQLLSGALEVFHRDLHSAGDALAKCVQTDQFSHGEGGALQRVYRARYDRATPPVFGP